MPRDATWCGGQWVVVGATADPAGSTRAAAWSSPNARTWRPMVLHPGGDHSAGQAILGSVGCSNGRLAVLGPTSGGAHGLPRTATWRERSDGSLAAVRAPYLRYGGTRAVEVSRLVGGEDGFLIAGTRASGAAVWTSRTGTVFRLHVGVPGLTDTPKVQTQAADAVDDRRGWFVVGTSTELLGHLFATVWRRSSDGGWTRATLPGGRTVTTGDRAVGVGPGLGPLEAGVLDQRLGLWLLRRGAWSLEGSFGERDPDGTSAPYVSGLTFGGGLVLATYSDGTVFRLAAGDSSPDESPLPVRVTVQGDHTATVAAVHGDEALLLTDDGHTGRTWTSPLPDAM